MRSAENSSARARPSTRGSAASSTGRSAARQASRSHGAQYAPSMPSSATGWMPTGVPNAGTPHASASITASPNPSACDGTSTALAALIQYGTSSGGTPPSVSSVDVAGGLARAVVALQRPRRDRAGTAGSGRRGRARAARAPRARGIGRKRSRSIPTGSTATRRVVPAPGRCALNSRETAAGSAVNGRTARVRRFERGWNRSLPCSVTTTGPSRAAAPATRSARSARARRRTAARGSAAAARAPRAGSRAGPGANANSSTSTSSRRRSASTWSRTNEPSAGRSGDGYMFVTTSARTGRRAYVRRLSHKSSHTRLEP